MIIHSIQHTINQYFAYYLGQPGFPTLEACVKFSQRIYLQSNPFGLIERFGNLSRSTFLASVSQEGMKK